MDLQCLLAVDMSLIWVRNFSRNWEITEHRKHKHTLVGWSDGRFVIHDGASVGLLKEEDDVGLVVGKVVGFCRRIR